MNTTFFEDINFKEIRSLIEIIITLKKKNYEYISDRYKLIGSNFNKNSKLLIDLGLIKLQNNTITTSNLLRGISLDSKYKNKEIKKIILESLLKKNSGEVSNFLNKFKPSKNVFIYKPYTRKRLKETGIRNFLIELGLVKYKINEDYYSINNEYISIYSDFIKQRSLTPEAFHQIETKRKEIGDLAELEILKYEIERLKDFPDIAEKIEHTATEDVGAGYDIKSFEIPDDNFSKKEIRYIEVKAVSILDYKFNWSKNEIQQSRIYKNHYYLYLLPVITSKIFDLENLIIIKNPYTKIFNKNDWEYEENGFSIWKNLDE